MIYLNTNHINQYHIIYLNKGVIMAKIRSGVLGNTRGKVSGIVGSQWKNINYIREYVKPANPQTAAQVVQRNKMSDCVAFAKPLVGSVFNAYTDKFQKGMSGFNYFIKGGIAEFDGSPVYGNLLLTEGKLSPITNFAGTYNTGTGEVLISYNQNYGNNGAAGDQMFWAVQDKSTGIWYFADGETDRSVGSDTQNIVSGLTATNLEAWLWPTKYIGTIVNMIANSAQATLSAA